MLIKIKSKRPQKNLIFLLFFFILTFSFAQEKIDPMTLYPESNQLEGWLLKDSVKEYMPDELFLQVGEVAGLYSEFGFTRSTGGVYINHKATRIVLEIFEMTDPGGAWGIYTMLSSGTGKEVKIGNIAKTYDQYIHFVKGNFYVRCAASNKEDGSMEVVSRMCLAVEEKILFHAKIPQVLLAFSFDEVDVTDVKYFRGQTGLNEVFDFHHGTFAGFRDGGSCRSGEILFFVLAYCDERKRREWFASAQGKVKMSQNQRFTNYMMIGDGFTATDRNGSPFAFKPYKNYILIIRGYEWSDGQVLFNRMGANLDKLSD